ncbi:MAG: alpha/beta hydrolase [Rhizobiaceae bacterium]|nr:alpha/beta hydrolase [Rhizobiaceae bacterium]
MAAEYDDFFYSAQDGLRLHARVYGAGNEGALPVICLAGLTRNAADFHDLAIHLSQRARTKRKVVAFDYRGRGESAWDKDWKHYDVIVEAGDVMAGLAALGIGHGAIVGTSRGGLVTYAIAALRPALMRAVVFNDIGPVVEGAGLANIRAYLERAPQPKNMADAVAIAKATQGSAFPALTDADWERSVRAFWREDGGRMAPMFDPALLNTVTGIDLNKPLPVLWPQFEGLYGVPMLAIRGENSMLLSAETFAEMGRRHPKIETVTVPGQGHAPFLETAGLPTRIAAFLERVDH